MSEDLPNSDELHDVYSQEGSLRPYIIFHWKSFETISTSWDPKDFSSSFKKKPPESRFAARVDSNNMIKIFESLQFHDRKALFDAQDLSPTVLNASNKEFCQEIDKFVNMCVDKRDRIKCITVVVSSHGMERKFTRNDEEMYGHQIRVTLGYKRNQNTREFTDEISDKEDDFFISTTLDLMKPFIDKYELENIPKIFLVQACSDRETSADVPFESGIDQGIEITLVDEVIDEYTDLPASVPVQGDQVPVQAQDDQGPDRDQRETPVMTYTPDCEDNCIVVFSSPSGYKSTSGDPRTGKGSILVEALTCSLKKMERTEFTLMEYLVQANRLASEQEDRKLGNRVSYKPLLRIIHQLSKDIKLKKV